MSNFYIDVYPENMSWDDWMSSVINITDSYNLSIVEESEWQEFARELLDTPELSAFGLPDPDAFEDWADWANNLLNATNGAIRV